MVDATKSNATEDKFSGLDEKIAYFRVRALEKSTHLSYASHRKAYFSFCEEYSIPPVPASPLQIARYTAHLASRLSANSIPKYLNIIRILHEEAGLGDPHIGDMFLVQQVRRGIEKEKGKGAKRVKPITPQILLSIRERLVLTEFNDAAIWAVCVLGFFGLLRRSNLLCPGLNDFDPQKHLARQAVSVSPEKISIQLNWAKNNQFKERSRVLILPSCPNHPLCPVAALSNYLALAPHLLPSHPLFWRLKQSGYTPMSYSFFCKCFQNILNSIGLDGKLFGTHSLRRGGATWGFQRGLSSDAIRALGDWQSDAYMAYLEVNTDFREKLVRELYINLPTHA